jgi:hypothetical protein
MRLKINHFPVIAHVFRFSISRKDDAEILILELTALTNKCPVFHIKIAAIQKYYFIQQLILRAHTSTEYAKIEMCFCEFEMSFSLVAISL